MVRWVVRTGTGRQLPGMLHSSMPEEGKAGRDKNVRLEVDRRG